MCGDCVHPEKILYVCTQCHARIELRPESETIRTLQEICAEIPDHPGITLVTEACEDCRDPNAPPGLISCYSLKPSEFH